MRANFTIKNVIGLKAILSTGCVLLGGSLYIEKSSCGRFYVIWCDQRPVTVRRFLWIDVTAGERDVINETINMPRPWYSSQCRICEICGMCCRVAHVPIFTNAMCK